MVSKITGYLSNQSGTVGCGEGFAGGAAGDQWVWHGASRSLGERGAVVAPF